MKTSFQWGEVPQSLGSSLSPAEGSDDSVLVAASTPQIPGLAGSQKIYRYAKFSLCLSNRSFRGWQHVATKWQKTCCQQQILILGPRDQSAYLPTCLLSNFRTKETWERRSWKFRPTNPLDTIHYSHQTYQHPTQN